MFSISQVLTRALSAGNGIPLFSGQRLLLPHASLSSKTELLLWLWLPRATETRYLRPLIPDIGFFWVDGNVLKLSNGDSYTVLKVLNKAHWSLKGKFFFLFVVVVFNAFFQEVFLDAQAHPLCQETLTPTKAGATVLRSNWVIHLGNREQGCGRTASSVEKSKAAENSSHFCCHGLRVHNNVIFD